MRIVYIDVDSLRPDHLGSYGYRRPTSPSIDALAEDATVMTGTYASSSPCMPSRGSWLSGVYGICHGVLTHWGPGSEFRFPGLGHSYFAEAPTFTRYLRQHGYQTVSFSSFMDRHQAFWYGAGWSQMQTFTLKQGDEDADEVNAAVLPWLRAHAKDAENLFLHVQYWDPHRQYTVPASWTKQVESAPISEWITEDVLAEQQRSYNPYSPRELFPGHRGDTSPTPVMPRWLNNLDDVHRFFDGYDGAIRFLDSQIGDLLAVLEELGILDETAIVLSADHGEAMGEGAVYGDHTSASSVVHHVPMIIRWPGHEGHRIDGLTYQMDMTATICDLLGLPVPPGWDARSFAGAVRGEQGWQGRPLLIWDHGLYCAQRVVRTDEWVYRRTYHPGVFEHPATALFHVDDVHEQHDHAADHPELVAEMDVQLGDWRRRQLERTGREDPMDAILRAGGPFRYIRPDQWARLLREHGRTSEADRMLTAIRTRGGTAVA